MGGGGGGSGGRGEGVEEGVCGGVASWGGGGYCKVLLHLGI